MKTKTKLKKKKKKVMSFMFMLAIVSLITSGKNINTQQDVQTEQFPYLYRCIAVF